MQRKVKHKFVDCQQLSFIRELCKGDADCIENLCKVAGDFWEAQPDQLVTQFKQKSCGKCSTKAERSLN